MKNRLVPLVYSSEMDFFIIGFDEVMKSPWVKTGGFMIPMQTIFLIRFSGQCAMVLVKAGSYLSPYFAFPRADSVVLIAEWPSLKNYSKSMV